MPLSYEGRTTLAFREAPPPAWIGLRQLPTSSAIASFDTAPRGKPSRLPLTAAAAVPAGGHLVALSQQCPLCGTRSRRCPTCHLCAGCSARGGRCYDCQDRAAASKAAHRIGEGTAPAELWAPSASRQLFEAAGSTEASNCLQLLSMGADPNWRSDYGATPLHRAAGAGHAATVELLLSSGAAVEVEDADGETALLAAAANGHADCLRTLLSAGADARASHLQAAAANAQVECVKALLRVPGLTDEGGVALRKASARLLIAASDRGAGGAGERAVRGAGLSGAMQLAKEKGAPPRDATVSLLQGLSGQSKLARDATRCVELLQAAAARQADGHEPDGKDAAQAGGARQGYLFSRLRRGAQEAAPMHEAASLEGRGAFAAAGAAVVGQQRGQGWSGQGWSSGRAAPRPKTPGPRPGAAAL